MTLKYSGAPELYLGRDRSRALALGPKQFRSLANAIRFTMERAAPVSRHGALLSFGQHHLDINQIRRVHRRLAAGMPPRLASRSELASA